MPTQTIYLDASKKQVDTAARGVFVITREVDEDGDLITERFGTLSEGEDEEDEEDEAKAAPQQRASAFSEEAKSRLWKAADAIATAHEAKLAGAARERFAADERQVLALLSGEKAAALQRKASVEEVIDNAITSTISRTIITHGCTQMMVLSMLFFGGTTLHYFAIALTIGILFGIYSSVFVAAAIAMWLGVKREDLIKPVKEKDETDGAVV